MFHRKSHTLFYFYNGTKQKSMKYFLRRDMCFPMYSEKMKKLGDRYMCCVHRYTHMYMSKARQ